MFMAVQRWKQLKIDCGSDQVVKALGELDGLMVTDEPSLDRM